MKLVNCGIHVIVEMTLVSSNLREIDDVLKKVNELGVSEFRIMKYVPNGVKDLDEQLSVSDEQFEEAIHLVYSNNLVVNNIVNVAFPCSQKFCYGGEVRYDNSSILYNCRAGINWFAVSYEGDVKICPHSTKTFGNICDDSISIIDIWNNGTRAEALSIIESRPQQCHECSTWDKCFGGCLLK
jgi:radical SAM protein with 4Fe4S-binding SPASM domain